MTTYDWTLGISVDREPAFQLPREMDARLRIEQFINKVTEKLYIDASDPVGLAPEASKARTVRSLAHELSELEHRLKPSLNGMSACNGRTIR